MKQPVERRLAAILAADVAGYSRLMGEDEEGTHERLKAHLCDLVDPKIKEHRGRIVKNTGDGMLAEFSSVVEAVRCAAEVQRGMAERNAETPEDKRITFRVGINLGDVARARVTATWNSPSCASSVTRRCLSPRPCTICRSSPPCPATPPISRSV
jgi:class 3 adenylate cyclase